MTGSRLTGQTYEVDVAGRAVDLPIVAISSDMAIALMMVIDMGLDFLAHVGREISGRLRDQKPEIVVGTATLGIPIAIEVSRQLGLDRYVILQKSPKIHLKDALVHRVTSITSSGEQRLMLDRRAVPLLAGRRTVIVDDVVATGESLKGAIALARAAEADIVASAVILTEGYAWRETLGDDAASIVALGHIPDFERGPGGRWVEAEGT